MSHFLDRDSDSDTDTDSTTSTTSSNENVPQKQTAISQQQDDEKFRDSQLNLPPGVYKWMKRAGADIELSDDDDDDVQGAVSRVDRATNALTDLCDEMELQMEVAKLDFEPIRKKLKRADDQAVKIMNNYQVLPKQYFEQLHFMEQDILARVQEAHDAIEEVEADGDEDELDDATKQEIAEFRELLACKPLKNLTKTVKELLKTHQSAIERANKPAPSSGSGEAGQEGADGAAGAPGAVNLSGTTQDLSEVGMLRTMSEFGIDPRNHTLKFERIVEASQQRGLSYITVTALAILCHATLAQEESQLFLPRPWWRRAFDFLQRALKMVSEDNLMVGEKWDIVVPGPGQEVTNRRRATVNGGFHALAARLKDSLYAWTQWNFANQLDYTARLVDEQAVVSLLDQCLRYYADLGHKKGQARCSMALLEVLHARSPSAHKLFMTGQPTMPAAPEKGWYAVSGVSSADAPKEEAVAAISKTISRLYDLVLTNDDTQKPVAILLVIINASLRDQFSTAREMFLLLGVNEVEKRRGRGSKAAVAHARCVAQLGLCAFRNGFFAESRQILEDLVGRSSKAMRGSNDIKELLGQKEHFKHLRDEELEEVNQRKLLHPPHHHVCVQLLETAHMVVTVLDEALAEARTHHRVRDRLFQEILRRFDFRALAGEPADDAEALYAIYQALLSGNVAQALTLVEGLSAWTRLPNREATVAALLHRVKVDALRTFLIAHGNHFKSLTVEHLATKFQLSAPEIRSVVSHLVLHENSAIVASFDRDGERIILDRGAQPRIHELAKDISSGLAQDFHDASYAAAQGSRSRGGRGGGGRGGRGGRGGGGNRRAKTSG